MAYSGKIEDPEEDDSKIKSKDREKRGKDLKGSILDGKIDTCFKNDPFLFYCNNSKKLLFCQNFDFR